MHFTPVTAAAGIACQTLGITGCGHMSQVYKPNLLF